MTNRITKRDPRNLPTPDTLPEDCPQWIKQDAPAVQELLDQCFPQRQPRPLERLTSREVCCSLLLRHHQGDHLQLSEQELGWCCQWIDEPWAIPTPVRAADLWEWSESRVKHGLDRKEFRRSYFWREFVQTATLQAMALDQRLQEVK